MANNIKSQLFSGVFYTALAKYSGVVISLVVAGILARLLSPDDFGIVAVATVIIAFFNLLTDMGVSPAIVQHKSLTKDDLSDIFSFTIWTGIGISILFFASSWIIADYYQSDTLRILCQLLSVNLFFASATIVPRAMFYRHIRHVPDHVPEARLRPDRELCAAAAGVRRTRCVAAADGRRAETVRVRHGAQDPARQPARRPLERCDHDRL